MTHTRRGLVIALGAFACYLVLRQGSGHGDGPGILLMLRQGAIGAAGNHFLYLPVLAGATAILEPLGLDAFTAGGVLSAAGTAVGAFFVHAACGRLAMAPRDALLVTLMTVGAPGVVFFATTVEMHGLFFGFAGAAIWRTAAWIDAPRATNGVWLGVATGLAFGAHATAHLLVPMLLAIAWAEWRAPKAWLRGAVLAAVAHVATVAASVGLAKALGSAVSVSGSVGFLQLFASAATQYLDRLPRELLDEWLWPFLLPSIAWLGGIAKAPRLAFVTGASLVVYFAVAFALTATAVEHGAYLLPLAWPAAWLVVRGFPTRAVIVITGVTIAFAAWFVTRIDAPERHEAYAQAIRTAAGDATPLVFIATPLDYEACAISLTDAEFFRILDLAPLPAATVLEAFDALLAKCADEGQPVFLSRGAREMLELAAERGAPAARPLLEHIAARYDREPFTDGFHGERLTPRSR